MFLSSLSEIIVSACLSYKIGTFAKESVETEGGNPKRGHPQTEGRGLLPERGFSCSVSAGFMLYKLLTFVRGSIYHFISLIFDNLS
jgi:hypothetical protein